MGYRKSPLAHFQHTKEKQMTFDALKNLHDQMLSEEHKAQLKLEQEGTMELLLLCHDNNLWLV